MESKRKLGQGTLSFAPLKVARTDDAGPTANEPINKTQKWTTIGDSLIARTGGKPSTKIAAFDLDGTLVNTKSGAKFALNGNDFVLFNENVKPKLQELHEDGFKLVIFSNQNGIKKAISGKKAMETKSRIDNFSKEVQVPIQAFCATQKDEYRKPEVGMWKYMLRHNNEGLEPDMDCVFFVGDAAGRPADFSDSDKEFAKRIGVKFYTPEEFFK
ncbi:hypothetical protein CYMTET_8641 [Cymbomonas tetramitiformis]|uniref:Uncharacterized protein n=1 Tax=Cymbomonas tetramitiformis TaxID=36881 RepID=A0AAE0GUH6_9CHLO|nr:hypothetical protein CYMTET_8641 [Cymbomonas tetramitiformis]